MSLLDSFTKKKRLTAAINQTAKARESASKVADSLYKSAYQDYADVLVGDLLRADTLYNWGFALLLQAKTKTDKDAIKLCEEAIAKFSFCLLLNPSYLGAAINGGVAYMDLARIKGVESDDELYELAANYFDKANAIQARSASYNLACIYALRDEKAACLEALENAKNSGYLPEVEEIMADPDLDKAKTQLWFVVFMNALTETAATEATEEALVEVVESPEVEADAEVVEQEVESTESVAESKTEQE